MQVGDVERLGVEDGDRSRAEAVRETLELGQLFRLGRAHARRELHRAEVHLRIDIVVSIATTRWRLKLLFL